MRPKPNNDHDIKRAFIWLKKKKGIPIINLVAMSLLLSYVFR